MAEKGYEMTYAGVKELQEELENRKNTVAAEIAERLKEARALGDLSENSEYDDAKEDQAKNQARIMEIEDILKNAKVIEDEQIGKKEVTLGSLVTIEDVEYNETFEYIVVSAKEEDIFKNKISSESPVGQAILGKKKGSVVEVKTPSGILKYKILKIDKPKN